MPSTPTWAWIGRDFGTTSHQPTTSPVGQRDQLRIALGDIVENEGPRLVERRRLEERQIPPLPRDEIEGAVKAFDMVLRYRNNFDRSSSRQRVIPPLAERPGNNYLGCDPPTTDRSNDQSRHHLPARPRQSRPRCRPPRDRARAGGRRRRRAVPGIRPDRSADVRQRPAEAGDLRHQPGVRPARGQGRRGRLCAFLRRVAAGADPRGGCGRRRARRLLRAVRGGAGAHQCAALWRRQSAGCAGLREPR